MSADRRADPVRAQRLLFAAGVVALVAAVIGTVLGLTVVNAVAGDLRRSFALSESAFLAAADTFEFFDEVAPDIDEGLAAAADSITSTSEGVALASARLQEVADFLDGSLATDIETLRQALPAAIQAAGAIDTTLRALSLVGVEYDPDQPFDQSLLAVEDALEDFPEQLRAQAEAIRALLPVSEGFAADASALAGSIEALDLEFDSSQGLVDSYREAAEEARSVLGEAGSALTMNTWLLRMVVAMMGLTGAALAMGLVILSRVLPAATIVVGDDAVSEPALD